MLFGLPTIPRQTQRPALALSTLRTGPAAIAGSSQIGHGGAMNRMSHAFATESPRLNPRPAPLASRLIGLVSPILLLVLVAQAQFRASGATWQVGAWSVGIVYILYDTALLLFTASAVRPLARGAETAP